MKNLKHIFIFFLFIGIAFVACKKDKAAEEAQDFGYNYFPDEAGRYIIYMVDSIHYDQAFSNDTTISFQYLLMEKIESTFLDNVNRPTLRIECYKKYYVDSIPYDSMQWILTDVWTANKTTTTLEKKEENIPYVKLIFPVKEGKIWNGNTFNTLGQRDYEITSADKTETINNTSFDSVVTVKQFEQIDFIQYRYEIEKFARNVGLIYKERDSIYHAGGADSVGYTVRQKIISYGK